MSHQRDEFSENYQLMRRSRSFFEILNYSSKAPHNNIFSIEILKIIYYILENDSYSNNTFENSIILNTYVA